MLWHLFIFALAFRRNKLFNWAVNQKKKKKMKKHNNNKKSASNHNKFELLDKCQTKSFEDMNILIKEV